MILFYLRRTFLRCRSRSSFLLRELPLLKSATLAPKGNQSVLYPVGRRRHQEFGVTPSLSGPPPSRMIVSQDPVEESLRLEQADASGSKT